MAANATARAIGLKKLGRADLVVPGAMKLANQVVKSKKQGTKVASK